MKIWLVIVRWKCNFVCSNSYKNITKVKTSKDLKIQNSNTNGKFSDTDDNLNLISDENNNKNGSLYSLNSLSSDMHSQLIENDPQISRTKRRIVNTKKFKKSKNQFWMKNEK